MIGPNNTARQPEYPPNPGHAQEIGAKTLKFTEAASNNTGESEKRDLETIMRQFDAAVEETVIAARKHAEAIYDHAGKIGKSKDRVEVQPDRSGVRYYVGLPPDRPLSPEEPPEQPELTGSGPEPELNPAEPKPKSGEPEPTGAAGGSLGGEKRGSLLREALTKLVKRSPIMRRVVTAAVAVVMVGTMFLSPGAAIEANAANHDATRNISHTDTLTPGAAVNLGAAVIAGDHDSISKAATGAIAGAIRGASAEKEVMGIINGYNKYGLYNSENKRHEINFCCAREVAEVCKNDPKEMVKYIAENQVESLAAYIAFLPEQVQPNGFKGLNLNQAEARLESLTPEEYDSVLKQFKATMDKAGISYQRIKGVCDNVYMHKINKDAATTYGNMELRRLTTVENGDFTVFTWTDEAGGSIGSMIVKATPTIVQTTSGSGGGGGDGGGGGAAEYVYIDDDCVQPMELREGEKPSPKYDGTKEVPDSEKPTLDRKSTRAEIDNAGEISRLELNEDETPQTSLDEVEAAREQAERERQWIEAAEKSAAEIRAREQAEAEQKAREEAAARQAAEAEQKAREEAAARQAAAAEAERQAAAEAEARRQAQEEADRIAREQQATAEAAAQNNEGRDAEDWANGAFSLGQP